MNENEIKSKMSQFCGSENYYKHWLPPYLYTDGIRYLEEICKASWLIDAVFSYARKEAFQVWELKVENSSAVLTMKEDTNEPYLVRQEIPYTDFPLNYIKMWCVGNILMLTSEY